MQTDPEKHTSMLLKCLILKRTECSRPKTSNNLNMCITLALNPSEGNAALLAQSIGKGIISTKESLK